MRSRRTRCGDRQLDARVDALARRAARGDPCAGTRSPSSTRMRDRVGEVELALGVVARRASRATRQSVAARRRRSRSSARGSRSSLRRTRRVSSTIARHAPSRAADDPAVGSGAVGLEREDVPRRPRRSCVVDERARGARRSSSGVSPRRARARRRRSPRAPRARRRRRRRCRAAAPGPRPSTPSYASCVSGEATTTTGSAPTSRAAAITQSTMRRPSSGWRCFGTADACGCRGRRPSRRLRGRRVRSPSVDGWGARIRTWDRGTKTRCLTTWLRPTDCGLCLSSRRQTVGAELAQLGEEHDQRDRRRTMPASDQRRSAADDTQRSDDARSTASACDAASDPGDLAARCRTRASRPAKT